MGHASRVKGRYILRWGNRQKTAKAAWGDERAAYHEAFELEEQLNQPHREILTWSYATTCYEEWQLCHSGDRNLSSWKTAKNRFAEWCSDSPPDIPKIDNTLLAQYAADLSKEVAMETVKGYFRYLSGFLKWCYDQEWIERIPKVNLPRRKRGEKRSKGRPLTGEEFDRMLAAIPAEVPEDCVMSWELLVRGLWETSLRLGEALKLHWTDPPVRLNLEGKYPMIDFEVLGHKGRTVTQLPVTPTFAALVKGRRRRGFVFRPRLMRGFTRSIYTWSHTISDFGKRAGIVVDQNERTEKKKCASAHDLRRSFLDRWKNAAILQVIARHELLNTTQTYYLSNQAEQVAQAIWEADTELPKNG